MTLSARPTVRAFIRFVAVVPVLASLMVAGSAAKVGPSVAGCAQAATVHHAALVVDDPGAATVTRCVAFNEDSITGDQLLARSGVEYATAYSGQAVCQINNQPAQYPATCWTSSSPYWAFYVSRGGGSWTFSTLGFASQTFRDGDAEGFRYEGQSDYTVPPSPAGVCPVPTPPTPTAVPTSRPSSSAVATHPSQRAAARSALPAAITAAASASASAPPAAPLAAAGTPSSTARRSVAAISAAPPSSPSSINAGAFAAGGLGAVLVVLLIAQVTGFGRRASRQRPQP
jgi:hypothetical protein